LGVVLVGLAPVGVGSTQRLLEELGHAPRVLEDPGALLAPLPGSKAHAQPAGQQRDHDGDDGERQHQLDQRESPLRVPPHRMPNPPGAAEPPGRAPAAPPGRAPAAPPGRTPKVLGCPALGVIGCWVPVVVVGWFPVTDGAVIGVRRVASSSIWFCPQRTPTVTRKRLSLGCSFPGMVSLGWSSSGSATSEVRRSHRKDPSSPPSAPSSVG